jgi:hypothetical protein
MSWSDESAAWLAQAIADHPEMDSAQLRRWCRSNYPFGQRNGWAYKAWLKTLRTYFSKQAAPPVKQAAPPTKAADAELSPAELEARGQLRLFP